MFNRGKIYMAKMRLRRDNFANFHDYYHNGNTDSDHFAIILRKIESDHRILVGEVDEFRSGITSEGFYFKNDKVRCKALSTRPCLIQDIHDNDVIMKLKVQPYDFTDSTGKRLVGISISALEINVKKSTD